MSYYDGLTPAYTFRIQIEREDRMVLDSSITTKGTKDEIAKVKRSVIRLLNEYAPAFKDPTPAPPNAASDPEPEQPAQAEPSEPVAHTDIITAADQQGQNATPTQTKVKKGKPAGARGLHLLHCPDCGNNFYMLPKEFQTDALCKCGGHIDLTDPALARFEADCPYCGKHTYGTTNKEDADISIQCKCGKDLNLWWDKENAEYRN